MDRHKTVSLPKKLVFLRPLVRDAAATLAAMPDNPDH